MSYQERFVPRQEGGENLGEYRYVARNEITQALDQYGYGPTKKYVDALYVHESGNKGVGLLHITDDHCRDHFGVFRGVDQAEAMGQTLLLVHHFTAGIPAGHSPLLRHMTVGYENPALPNMLLNIIVRKGESDHRGFTGDGIVFSGDIVLSKGSVQGRMIRTDTLAKLLQRSRKIQERSHVVFPFEE
jgi:hypothetical protein